MSSVRADSLDDFLPYIQTSDTKKRLHTYEQLVGYLRCSYTSLECRNMEKVIDGLIAWISSSNYKVNLIFLSLLVKTLHFCIAIAGAMVMCLVGRADWP